MTAFLDILWFAVPFAILVVAFRLAGQRSKRLVQEWAKEHEIRLISCSPRYILRGPFFWMSEGDGRVVYRVKVQFCSGRIVRGWVRCGNAAAGPPYPQIETRWDDGIAFEPLGDPNQSELPGFPVVVHEEKETNGSGK